MILVCAQGEIADGSAVRVENGDRPIAVFNVDGELFAIDDTCTHQDASLADGWLDGCTVECPLHASCFDLRTGKPTGPPAKVAVRTHGVDHARSKDCRVAGTYQEAAPLSTPKADTFCR